MYTPPKLNNYPLKNVGRNSFPFDFRPIYPVFRIFCFKIAGGGVHVFPYPFSDPMAEGGRVSLLVFLSKVPQTNKQINSKAQHFEAPNFGVP